MKKINKKLFLGMLISSISLPLIVMAAPPEKPSGDNNAPGGAPGSVPGGNSSSANISYSGATTISSNTTESSKTYKSTTGGQNAILASGGTSTLNTCTITKSGDSSGDDADFYGTNAAVLSYNGATLNIKGGSITTNGSHANAVFAYGKGVINISDASISTTSNNSGGVMVTGGGTLNATNLTVDTKGNSSAAIRSDRGGGDLTVTGGSYVTSGTGSPVIYSTANIVVNNATLTSNSSEGAVVEGANSITLNNVTLTDTNNTLNGNSETYKNIFLYQSMSGDASEGTASFTSKNSQIITNKGDTIFVTNTTATINLENNKIVNNDGDFLRIQKGKWGNSGSNGGNVTLTMTNQKVSGGIVVDSISTLDMIVKSGSVFAGSIDNENTAKKVSLTLSSDSVLYLTKDSYVDSLTNEVEDNSNIYLNGHKLYVNGKEVSGNNGTYTLDDSWEIDEDATVEEETESKDKSSSKSSNTEKDNNNIVYYIAGGSALLILGATSVVLLIKKHKKENQRFDI